ncbi:Thymic stromal cotransporter [Orchesella cincta]|uniref:Thymic stromal cotransporter n=1 Tax=Orchesella cincta TaxID=48709 RepID=A0A1D2NGV8_ORCCI|nr:Thymic stromal cotransporter [Orchesella cincta]
MGWRNVITVEPAMFLQQAGDTLTYVIFQNLFIDKICRNQLHYDEKVCNLYESVQDEIPKSQEFLIPIINDIQETSANFVLYYSLVENSLPVLLVLFLGVWSDANHKRKPCLVLSLMGKFCRSVGLLLNAYYMAWHPLVLLFTVALPHSLGGGNAVFHMAAFSYIADSSVPRSRTWRLGVAEAFWFLGSPVGLYLGAYLYERGGYLCVFATAVTFHFIAVLYTSLILPEVPQPRASQYVIGKYGTYGTSYNPVLVRTRCFSENEKGMTDNGDNNNENQALISGSRAASNPTNPHDESINVWDFVIGTMKTVVKKRPNHTRKCLLSLGTILLLYGIANHGELNMKYLFTRTKFHWREQQFSVWTIVDACVVVLGLFIMMPVFSKVFKFSDTFSGAVAALTRAVSKLCIALATDSQYLFIALGIDIPGVMGPLSSRSLASKCVLRDERGKVFAFLGCIEALVPLIAVPLYSLIYSSTLRTVPSAIYYVSAAICFTNFLIFITLFIFSKLKIIQFSGTDTSALTNPTDSVRSYDIENGLSYFYRRSSLS